MSGGRRRAERSAVEERAGRCGGRGGVVGGRRGTGGGEGRSGGGVGLRGMRGMAGFGGGGGWDMGGVGGGGLGGLIRGACRANEGVGGPEGGLEDHWRLEDRRLGLEDPEGVWRAQRGFGGAKVKVGGPVAGFGGPKELLEDQEWTIGGPVVEFGGLRGALEDPEGVWRTKEGAEELIVEFGGPVGGGRGTAGGWRTNSRVWRAKRGGWRTNSGA